MWEALRSLTFRETGCEEEKEGVEEGVTSECTEKAPEPESDAQW